MTKVVTFLREVKAELAKVSWPTKDELIGSVIVVCVLVAASAVIFGAMDASFSMLIRNIIQ